MALPKRASGFWTRTTSTEPLTASPTKFWRGTAPLMSDPGRDPHPRRAAGAAAGGKLKEIAGAAHRSGNSTSTCTATTSRASPTTRFSRPRRSRSARRQGGRAGGRRAVHRPNDPRRAGRSDGSGAAGLGATCGAGRPGAPRAADPGRLRRQERRHLQAPSRSTSVSTKSTARTKCSSDRSAGDEQS